MAFRLIGFHMKRMEYSNGMIQYTSDMSMYLVFTLTKKNKYNYSKQFDFKTTCDDVIFFSLKYLQ